MKKKSFRIISAVLTLTLMLSMLTGIAPVSFKASKAQAAGTEILNVSELDDASIETNTQFGVFTVVAASGKGVTIENNDKVSADGTLVFTKRLKLNGTGAIEHRNISFSTSGEATLKVYGMSGSSSADRNLLLVNASGATVDTQVMYGKAENGIQVATYKIPSAGMYFLYSEGSGINLYYLELVQGAGSEETVSTRKAWNTVKAPVLSDAVADDYSGEITVNFKMEIGAATDGCDRMFVYLVNNATGEKVDSKSVFVQSTEGVVTFAPKNSGKYSIYAEAVRDGEDKVLTSNKIASVTFKYPLKAPNLKSATNKGNGSIELVWDAANEATGYDVLYKEESDVSYKSIDLTCETESLIEGLTVGKTYDFVVASLRDDERSKVSSKLTATATEKAERTWSFVTYGSSTSTSTNYYEGGINSTGAVTVNSTGGKGKIVPASCDDGIAFYYTVLDPMADNFVLSGNIHVDSWTFSNGQEGFGFMASDTIGKNGDATAVWNNSLMVASTKIEYYYDTEEDIIVDAKTETSKKVSMKLGIGSILRYGVTAANIADGTIVKNTKDLFTSKVETLETSQVYAPTFVGDKKISSFNIIANATNAVEGTDKDNALTDLRFTISRDNTGFKVVYTDAKGREHFTEHYDADRSFLTQIDPDHMYIGFFAARNARITVSDVTLTVTEAATDAPAKERIIKEVTPVIEVTSATSTGILDYNFSFYSNADGTAKIIDNTGRTLAKDVRVKAKTYTDIPVELNADSTLKLSVAFTPDADFKPSEYEILNSYETIIKTINVNTGSLPSKLVYISPEGKAGAKGTKDDPITLIAAVRFATPGTTIVIKEGTYLLENSIRVERGNNGTADERIYFIADPEAKTRPVFDFQRLSEGFVFGGNYWTISGFEVIHSMNAKKGIQLSGSNCVIQDVIAHDNGSTGIQISRLFNNDMFEQWPANNLVLNCTSYNNYDLGYEDGDGFAAKITVGEGNVFDGCIAYNNADDGYDLYAYVNLGHIGVVTIRNCIAYNNGYLVDGTNAGNGNGFKMGGQSVTGNHQLINSIAYENKAKGIDSNSCPDIKVTNSISVNNGSYNVAFYTNNAADTDYVANGIISLRTNGSSVAEQLKFKGEQVESNAKNETTFYFDATSNKSLNTKGEEVSAANFKSVDSKSISFSRNADGTINMNGLFEITSAPTGFTNGQVIGGMPTESFEDHIAKLSAAAAENEKDDTKTEEAKTEEPKQEETKQEETKQEETKTEESKTEVNTGSEKTENNDTQTAVATPAPAQSQSSAGSPLVIIIIVIIALLAVLAVLFFVLKGKKKK